MEQARRYSLDSQHFYPDSWLVDLYLSSNYADYSDFDQFEKRFKLNPLPSNPMPISEIFNKTDAKEVGVVPEGNTLWQQASSLLPTAFLIGRDAPTRIANKISNKTVEPPEEIHRTLTEYITILNSDREQYNWLLKALENEARIKQVEFRAELYIRYVLTYVFARHIDGKLPRTASWLDETCNLDVFTSSLFALLILARSSSMKIRWVSALHSTESVVLPLSHISPTIPRPEGAPLYASNVYYQEILRRLSSSTCVLSDDLLRVIDFILGSGPLKGISGGLVKKALGVSLRAARYKARILERSVREHFIPNFPLMNLRYRYVFIAGAWEENISDAIIEKRYLIDSKYSNVGTHLEPYDAKQPLLRGFDSFDIAVDYDSLSLRLDLYDLESKSWKIEPWRIDSQEDPNDHVRWLHVDLNGEGRPYSLTPRELKLVMILLGNEAGAKDRYRLLRMMKYPLPTAREGLQRLLKRNQMAVLYHPQTVYSSLPNEMLLAIREASPSDIKRIGNWLASTLPYVHRRVDNSHQNAVFHIRMPLLKTAIAKGIIESELEGQEALVSRVRKRKQYYLTVYQKAFDPKMSSLADPWA